MLIAIAFLMFALLIASWLVLPEQREVAVAQPKVAERLNVDPGTVLVQA